MDAFFCIVLSVLVIRWYWKRQNIKLARKVETTFIQEKEEPVKEVKKTKEEDLRQKEYDDLRKQGYDDELIAVILPTINNGQ